jgi:hypothetical protein
VWLAGQDDMVDAERVVLREPFGDLAVAADQGGTGAGPDQTEAGPEVRRHFEVVAAGQFGHPALPLGLGTGEAFPGDDVQSDPVRERSVLIFGESADRIQLGRDVSPISAAVVSQASSQNVPVGVSTPSKPSRSAARATNAR